MSTRTVAASGRAEPRRRWPPRRALPGALAASLLLHLLLLPVLGRWYRASGDVAPSAAATVENVGLRLSSPAPRPPSPPNAAVPPLASTAPPSEMADTAVAPTAPVASAAEPVSGGGGSAAERLRPGFEDPRLYLNPAAQLRVGEAAAPMSMQGRFGAALLADDDSVAARERRALARRQITILGRRITVFGGSDAATWRRATAVAAGRRAILTIDGREWEELQMRRQQTDFVRDSILGERARATRLQRDEDRHGPDRSPPADPAD
jgi:hypothetical protein